MSLPRLSDAAFSKAFKRSLASRPENSVTMEIAQTARSSEVDSTKFECYADTLGITLHSCLSPGITNWSQRQSCLHANSYSRVQPRTKFWTNQPRKEDCVS